MMVVDASAIVAILTREPEAAALSQRLQQAAHPITSPIAIYEAVLAIRRQRNRAIADIHQEVVRFLSAAGIEIVPVAPTEADGALAAHDRYGKGTGHPASLNMGDCFIYALAKAQGAALLYKGNDFAQTDLR